MKKICLWKPCSKDFETVDRMKSCCSKKCHDKQMEYAYWANLQFNTFEGVKNFTAKTCEAKIKEIENES